MAGSPGVTIKRSSVLARVPEFTGVPAAIALPLNRGPVMQPTLLNGEAETLAAFTEFGRIEIGHDLSIFSAVAFQQKSTSLYVVRPDNGAEYGGVIIKKASAAGANSGISNSVEMSDPEAFVFGADDAFIIVGANPGDWNNRLSYTVTDNSSRDPGTFYITVFQNNVQVEKLLCSRNPQKKDGNGRVIYLEAVGQTSAWVRIIDNVAANANEPLKYQPTAIVGTGGDNGDPVTDGMMLLAMDKFRDSEGIKVTLLLDGGRATASYATGLADIAEEREDCIALLSVPYAAEASSTFMTDILDYVNDELNLNTSAAAIYSPHVEIYDRYNDRKIWASPEAYAGAVISETAANYEIFFAPAGDNAALNVTDVRQRFSKAQRGVLYDSNINPLRFTKGKGIRIWGQKTLLRIPSYLDRLNVKLLEITIVPGIAELLDGFTFQFNDESTRATVKARVEAYMESVKGRRGVVDFRVVCDTSNNDAAARAANKIVINLQAEPNVVGEYVEFGSELTALGEVTTVLLAA